MTIVSPGTAGLPLLPVPGIPARARRPASGTVAFTAGHHFTADGLADPAALGEAAAVPLSVIVQVTKRCDFNCGFCSETLQMADPTLAQLAVIGANLGGVARVFLSGGEPLLRQDLPEIAAMFSGFVIGLPTNATRGLVMAPRLAGKVAFVNIGFDGPRATFARARGGSAKAMTGARAFRAAGLPGPRAPFARVRGDYDKAMTGVRAFQAAGLPVSLSAVVLRSTVHALPYLCQIADVLDAGKLKLILPLRKGNALGLPEREFISVDEARDAFDHLTELRFVHDWRPAVRMTPWTAATEGHMIVVEPDGTAQAWPVYDQPDLFLRLGNLLTEPITAI